MAKAERTVFRITLYEASWSMCGSFINQFEVPGTPIYHVLRYGTDRCAMLPSPHPLPLRHTTRFLFRLPFTRCFYSLTLDFCNPLFPFLSLSLFTYQCSVMYVLAQCDSRLAVLTSGFYLYHPAWLYKHDGVSSSIKILGFRCLIPIDSSSFKGS